jgi:hypothetical protein
LEHQFEATRLNTGAMTDPTSLFVNFRTTRIPALEPIPFDPWAMASVWRAENVPHTLTAITSAVS